jgi:DedD protein
MDRSLKERLVGAAVLVALGVWLIPWVLDGSNEPVETVASSLTLPIPSSDEPSRSQTITLDNDRAPPAAPPAPISDTTPDTKPDTGGEAPAEAPVPSVAAADAGAGWYVQAGSFEDVANARRQADRVSSFGFDAQVFTTSAGGRTMQRVRVGPQSSRERAEAVASALSAHGFVVQVLGED